MATRTVDLGSVIGPQGPRGPRGRGSARFVVGTSAAGWTADDCDYLCDGAADQVEINAAIQALPAGGGQVVILDGTYTLTGAISVNKDGVTLSGTGYATNLAGKFANGYCVEVTAGNCVVCDLRFCDHGVWLNNAKKCVVHGISADVSGYAICIDAGATNNLVVGNTAVGDSGIRLLGNYNIVLGNNIPYGTSPIEVFGTGNVIVGNLTSSEDDYTFYVSGSKNIVLGNGCSVANNGTGNVVVNNVNAI